MVRQVRPDSNLFSEQGIIRSGPPHLDVTGEDPKRGASDATTGSGRQGGTECHMLQLLQGGSDFSSFSYLFFPYLSTVQGLNMTFSWLNHA